MERIINEPSAAALAYRQQNKCEGLNLIFDFGGGTLDISAVDSFNHCHSLTSFTVPKGITKIQNEAFCCKNLTRIIIPQTVTKIAEDPFTSWIQKIITVFTDAKSKPKTWLFDHPIVFDYNIQ